MVNTEIIQDLQFCIIRRWLDREYSWYMTVPLGFHCLLMTGGGTEFCSPLCPITKKIFSDINTKTHIDRIRIFLFRSVTTVAYASVVTTNNAVYK